MIYVTAMVPPTFWCLKCEGACTVIITEDGLYCTACKHVR